jgi:hypothetical protein
LRPNSSKAFGYRDRQSQSGRALCRPWKRVRPASRMASRGRARMSRCKDLQDRRILPVSGRAPSALCAVWRGLNQTTQLWHMLTRPPAAKSPPGATASAQGHQARSPRLRRRRGHRLTCPLPPFAKGGEGGFPTGSVGHAMDQSHRLIECRFMEAFWQRWIHDHYNHNVAQRAEGTGGRTVSTTCWASGAPGSMDALRPRARLYQ